MQMILLTNDRWHYQLSFVTIYITKQKTKGILNIGRPFKTDNTYSYSGCFLALSLSANLAPSLSLSYESISASVLEGAQGLHLGQRQNKKKIW